MFKKSGKNVNFFQTLNLLFDFRWFKGSIFCSKRKLRKHLTSGGQKDDIRHTDHVLVT